MRSTNKRPGAAARELRIRRLKRRLEGIVAESAKGSPEEVSASRALDEIYWKTEDRRDRQAPRRISMAETGVQPGRLPPIPRHPGRVPKDSKRRR